MHYCYDLQYHHLIFNMALQLFSFMNTLNEETLTFMDGQFIAIKIRDL